MTSQVASSQGSQADNQPIVRASAFPLVQDRPPLCTCNLPRQTSPSHGMLFASLIASDISSRQLQPLGRGAPKQSNKLRVLVSAAVTQLPNEFDFEALSSLVMIVQRAIRSGRTADHSAKPNPFGSSLSFPNATVHPVL